MSVYTCMACRVAFHDVELQRSHYKTDWHRYNLKRKVADMPPVTAENFQERVLAQKAQVENDAKDVSSHCSVCNKHFNTENAFQNHIQSKKHKEQAAKQTQRQDSTLSTDDGKSLVAEKNVKNTALKEGLQKEKGLVVGQTSAEAGQSSSPGGSSAGPSCSMAAASSDVRMDDDANSDSGSWESWEGDALVLEECLFCSHMSSTLDKNIKHMTLSHSFFLPDIEFVCDLEGLVRYLGEKVGEGHICLWCNTKSKSFRTTKAVQQHMVDKGHCKVFHEGDVVFEYADYYDYRSSYPDYVPSDKEEPMGEDIEVEPEQLDENNFQLVLPSGSVIGHRSLMRYFRQKLRPDRQVAIRNSGSISRAMAQYKALGWTGTTGPLAQKKARDLSHFHRVHNKHYMRLGVKANIMQHHYREQVFY